MYLHGFNSSPQSHKAQVMARHMSERGLAAEYACPALPPWAPQALALQQLRLHCLHPRLFALQRALSQVDSTMGQLWSYTCQPTCPTAEAGYAPSRRSGCTFGITSSEAPGTRDQRL